VKSGSSPDRASVMPADLPRRVVAEAIATGLLLSAIVGSGIMAVRLADGNAALALLANSLATGAALLAILSAFQPISGAHLNPVVTMLDAWNGTLRWSHVPPLVVAQLAGAAGGVLMAHAMFGEPLIGWAAHDRSGGALVLSEGVATFGLVAVVTACGRLRSDAIPAAVSGYVVAAYWFTASTAFANPAVTLARALTATFTGIRWIDTPGFVAGQVLGGVAGYLLVTWLLDRGAPPLTAAPPAPDPRRS
jgi:glycerol uptake facilitator-like aquaporin